jgi:hypothetical protein
MVELVVDAFGMSVIVHREGRLVVVQCIGQYSPDDIFQRLDEAERAPNYPEEPEMLLDVRNAQSVLRRPSRELRGVTHRFARRAARYGHRCAILVEGRLRYGLMRMAATWIGFENVDARVFTSEPEAKQWLLEVAPVRPR